MNRLAAWRWPISVACALVLFPPWRTTFYPLGGYQIPSFSIELPWPNPSFTVSGFSWARAHSFSWPISVFSPPRIEAESLDGSIVGVWSTTTDSQRLAMMMLAVAVVVRLMMMSSPYVVAVLDRLPPLFDRK